MLGTLHEESAEEIVLPEMTGEQFAWHIQHVMWGLYRLRWVALPDRIAKLENAPSEPDWTLLTDMGIVEQVGSIVQYRMKLKELLDDMRGALDTATRLTDETTKLFGVDWGDLAYMKRDAVLIAYRMGQLDPAAVHRWYRMTVTALHIGHRALEADVDFRLAMANAEVGYWARMNELWQYPIRPFQMLISAAAAFAAGILRSAGQAARAVGEGALDAFLEALKGLAVPLIIVGGVVLGGPYVLQFAAANWRKVKGRTAPELDGFRHRRRLYR